MVVDDNPLNLKLTRVVLETEGYSVATAAEAEEAPSVVENSPRALPHVAAGHLNGEKR